jgi:uncharacterized delta-60 repeat protein
MLFPKASCLGTASLFASLFTIPSWASDGLPDPGFGLDGVAYITPDDVEARALKPYAAIALPDGKLLFAGERNKFIDTSPFDPHMHGMLARLNADGSADASFGNIPAMPGVVVLPDLVPATGAGMQIIEAMERLDDGSIIVAGTAQAFGPLKGFVVKLDAQGAMDTSFGSNGLVLLSGTYLHALAIDSQHRIVVAGEKAISGISHSFVARLDASGQPDTAFGTSGDGTVVINWDGVAGQGGYIASMGLTSSDGILVGGNYEVYGMGAGSDFAIARLDVNGALDTTFAGTGWRVFHRPDEAPGLVIDSIERLLPTDTGGVVFAGHYNLDDGEGNNTINVVLGSIAADGSADANFGAPASPGFQPIELVPGFGSRYPTGLARQSDGKLVVSVTYVTQDKSKFLALRTLANGELDSSFGNGGIQLADLAPGGDGASDASTMMLDASGRVVLAGTAERTPPLYELAVLRLTHEEAPVDRIFADGFEDHR